VTHKFAFFVLDESAVAFFANAYFAVVGANSAEMPVIVFGWFWWKIKVYAGFCVDLVGYL